LSPHPDFGRNIGMDIWQAAILGGVVLIALYGAIRSRAERRHEEQLIRELFVYAYQTKDHLIHLSAFQDHSTEIRERFSWIKQAELERIEKSLVRKSMALSILFYMKMRSFDFIRTHALLNVALQNEDFAAINKILEITYGPEYRRYDVDLNDDEMSPILDLLKELTGSKK
jgi:hypothetical protein